ncbi:hypothetical protein [Streptomyces sp. IBSBF 2435]|uniref:hypothetical protein n=1 Tax=Streptomyces sp. IBSBF 2435 TaxID=2903531 RepID=UPI002FDC69EF
MTALIPDCTTSGCGSLGAYLDTSTARMSGWVEVRTAGGAAATAHWYCTALCAALTLGGGQVEAAVRTRLASNLDAAAARLAADPALDLGLLLDRIRGIEIARRLVQPDRAGDVARCHVCGCTEDDPCAGGCAWVPGGMEDTCTSCAPPVPCTTAGCGTPEHKVDGSDPALWGWICVWVGGTDARMRWVCSPPCALDAIEAGGAELAAQDTAAAAAPSEVPR